MKILNNEIYKCILWQKFLKILKDKISKSIHTYPPISITSFFNDSVQRKNFYRLSSAKRLLKNLPIDQQIIQIRRNNFLPHSTNLLQPCDMFAYQKWFLRYASTSSGMHVRFICSLKNKKKKREIENRHREKKEKK